MRRLTIVLGLLCVGVIALLLANPMTLAQDDGNLPTPEPYPVDGLAFQLTTVGGDDSSRTFPGYEADGITVSETTVESNYPRGMVFTMQASSANGDIQEPLLFLEYVNGDRERFYASWDGGTESWVAKPWEFGDNDSPAWKAFEFYWSVRDSAGTRITTEPHALDYWDPTREWYRVESDHVIAYWFGFQDVEPETVAQWIAEAVESTEPRRQAGFGGPLGYKPIGVLYPDRETLGEFVGTGLSNTNAAGWTSDALGMTIQHVAVPTQEWFERLEDCIYLTPLEDRTWEYRIRGTAFGTIPHEITHLYQFEYGVGGPLWWTEGEAEWFTHSAGSYDRRLRHLATLQNIPSLDGNNIGASGIEADGCYALAYDVGPSFINWLLTNYGGVEAHAELVHHMRGSMTVQEAIEELTGKSFFEVENEWRAYIGFEQLTLADVDPASALQDPIEGVFAAGESVTIPSAPMIVPLAEAPGSKLGAGQCFGGSTVTILRVGSLDGVDYYQVDCQGMIGWLTLDQLQQ